MSQALNLHDGSRSLEQLSDSCLLSRLDTLTARERRITLCIIDHLIEVERRDLHLREGYGSMFSYCTERLGYSASGASRRIRTARCVCRFPVVRAMIESRRVNLTTVSMVAGLLTDANHVALLERIAGRTQDEVKAIAAEYNPRTRVRDRIEPVCVKAPAAATSVEVEAAVVSATNRTLSCEYDRNGCHHPPPAALGAAGDSRPVGYGEVLSSPARNRPRIDGDDSETTPAARGTEDTPEHAGDRRDAVTAGTGGGVEKLVKITFTAPEALKQQIEAARALLSFRLPAGAPLADVMGLVLDDFIERNDPSRRRARRAERKRKKNGKKNADRQLRTHTTRTSREHGKKDRHTTIDEGGETLRNRDGKQSKMKRENPDPRAIPAATRDEVAAESGGRCEYVSPAGRRCDATTYLQVDHIVPVALGGMANRGNLRVLCARHNRMEAQRWLGNRNTGRKKDGTSEFEVAGRQQSVLRE